GQGAEGGLTVALQPADRLPDLYVPEIDGRWTVMLVTVDVGEVLAIGRQGKAVDRPQRNKSFLVLARQVPKPKPPRDSIRLWSRAAGEQEKVLASRQVLQPVDNLVLGGAGVE